MLLRAEAATQGNCFDAKSATCSNSRSTKSAAGLSTRLVQSLKLIHSFPDACRQHIAILDVPAADADSWSKALIDLLRRSFVSPKLPLPPINSYLARHLTT